MLLSEFLKGYMQNSNWIRDKLICTYFHVKDKKYVPDMYYKEDIIKEKPCNIWGA